MPHLTILQLYRGGQYYWWSKPEYAKKIVDLPKVTDIMLYRKHFAMGGIRTHNIRRERYWLHM